MRRIISAAVLMTSAFALEAQINARLDPLADGTTRIGIANDAVGELSAFAVSMKETNGLIEEGRLTIYADSAIDAAATPVLAHQRWFVEAGFCAMPQNGKRACTVFEQPIIAGIFADGSTTGDATILNQLLSRRRNMLHAVEIAGHTIRRRQTQCSPAAACREVSKNRAFRGPLVPSWRTARGAHSLSIDDRKIDRLAGNSARIAIPAGCFYRARDSHFEPETSYAAGAPSRIE